MSDLTGAGYFKSFFGTGICFNLRHFTRVLDYTLEVLVPWHHPF